MRYPLLAIIFVFIITSAFQQDSVQKVWDINSPLQWSDYQAPEKPDYKDPRVRSNTLTGELFTYKRLGKDSDSYSFKFATRSVMIRSKSWVDPAYKTPELLQHEQLHFNLSAYFARQLLTALTNHTYSKDYKEEMKAIRHEISVQRTAMNNLYDDQTTHSLNKKMQARWQVFVTHLLNDNINLEEAIKNEPTK